MLCWILLSVTSLKRLTRWSSFSIQTSNQIFLYHENINCLLLKFFNSIIPTKYNLRLSFPCSILNWILPNPLMDILHQFEPWWLYDVLLQLSGGLGCDVYIEATGAGPSVKWVDITTIIINAKLTINYFHCSMMTFWRHNFSPRQGLSMLARMGRFVSSFEIPSYTSFLLVISKYDWDDLFVSTILKWKGLGV